jgi:hypothetical protein
MNRIARDVLVLASILVATSGARFAAAAPPKKPSVSAPVVAPEPPKPVVVALPTLTETLTGPAKASYESAKLLFRDGDFKGALVQFQSAYGASKDARLKWNLAACEKNLRHYSQVKRLLREYVAESEKLTDEDRNDAVELLRVIEPFTAKLRIEASEPDAAVYIDDVAVGKTPLPAPVELDIGVHKVRVQKDDYEAFALDVPVGGAPELSMNAKLVRIVHEGRLVLKAPSNAVVTLDGKVVGQGSYQGVLHSGGHSLRVTAPDFRSYQSEILVEDNKVRTLDITLEPEVKKGVPTWVWVLSGSVVAAGAVGVGSYFLLKPGDPIKPAGTFSPGSADIPVAGFGSTGRIKAY